MSRKPTSLQRIRQLIDETEWNAAERLLTRELARAQASKDWILEAQCYSYLGNLDEMNWRIGDAFRHWSHSLAILVSLGYDCRHAEVVRLRRLIRRWHETPRVWVSYSHVDKTRVEAVLNVLRRQHIEILYDEQFLSGHQIQRQILTGIASCPKHIVFWSANARRSSWVLFEREVIMNTLKEKIRENTEQGAFDNNFILYCLGSPPNDSEINDCHLIIERHVGFKLATRQLIRSIVTSELLAPLEARLPLKCRNRRTSQGRKPYRSRAPSNSSLRPD